jgi:CO dehydrogenase maturation factor
MEHISRRTTRDVDFLLLVTDPTIRGVKTAGEMVRLAEEVEVNVNEIKLIMNRAEEELPAPLKGAIEELGLEIAALIPADKEVNYLDAMGEPLTNLNGDSPAWRAVHELTGELLG